MMKWCILLLVVPGCGSTPSPLSTRNDECSYMTDEGYDAVVAILHEFRLAGIGRDDVFFEFLAADQLDGRGIVCLEALLEDEWG